MNYGASDGQFLGQYVDLRSQKIIQAELKPKPRCQPSLNPQLYIIQGGSPGLPGTPAAGRTLGDCYSSW